MSELTVLLIEKQSVAWGTLRSLWREIRPAQWLKNLTVFAPLLFAQQLFIPSAFARMLSEIHT